MPHVILIVALGLAGGALWRLMRREMNRVAETLGEVRAEARVPTEIVGGPRLLRGADGVYRPEPH